MFCLMTRRDGNLNASENLPSASPRTAAAASLMLVSTLHATFCYPITYQRDKKAESSRSPIEFAGEVCVRTLTLKYITSL